MFLLLWYTIYLTLLYSRDTAFDIQRFWEFYMPVSSTTYVSSFLQTLIKEPQSMVVDTGI